jgi:hypothetical protein
MLRAVIPSASLPQRAIPTKKSIHGAVHFDLFLLKRDHFINCTNLPLAHVWLLYTERDALSRNKVRYSKTGTLNQESSDNALALV